MSKIRLYRDSSGYSEIVAQNATGDLQFDLPGTGGTLDRLNRAGNVLQVVNATYSTATLSSSTTYADTGLTASITPSSASNKILVLVNQSDVGKTADNSQNGVNLRLLRGSTSILTFGIAIAYTGTALGISVGTCSAYFLDSPSTTLSVTYKTQFASYNGAVNAYVQGNGGASTITLMEIAA